MSNGHDGWNPWTLDDTDSVRERYTKSNTQRGPTRLIQFRAPEFWALRADMIVASRIEPDFRTLSDLMTDALVMLVQDWDKRYPDGVGGTLAYQTRLLLQQHQRERREQFIESATEELEVLQRNRDVRGLNNFLQILLQAQGDLKDDAPASYLERLDDMIDKARRLVGAAV